MFFAEKGFGSGAADCFDAANPGSSRSLRFYFKDADVRSFTDMGSAAEFHRVTVESFVAPPNLDNAYKLTIFITEKLHDVFAAFYLWVWDFNPRDRIVSFDCKINLFLNGFDLLLSDRF